MTTKNFIIASVITLGLSTTLSMSASAQAAFEVVRDEQPITYWVNADRLSVRNTPIAGDAVSELDIGRKVFAYSRFENWVRISPENEEEHWVNSDFLTNEDFSWASYSLSSGSRRNQPYRQSKDFDVDLRKVTLEEKSKSRVYAALITELPNLNRTIVTKQKVDGRSYYEKHLIACNDKGGATGLKLVGEGYDYLGMERDVRGRNLESTNPHDISKDTPPTAGSIAKFACLNLPN